MMMCIKTFKMINLYYALLAKKKKKGEVESESDDFYIYFFFSVCVVFSIAMGTLVYIE